MWSQRINDLLPMKSPWPCFRGLVGNNQNLATTPLAGNRRLTSRTRRRAASKMSLSSCQSSGTQQAGEARTVTAVNHVEVPSQGRQSSTELKNQKQTKRGTRTERRC